jgi:integrator complex subunit 11
MTEKANHYYRLFIHWTNQKIKETFQCRNMFDFKHIKPFEKHFADEPGPIFLFASPGMLHSGTSLSKVVVSFLFCLGTSLEIFKKWAPDPKNMVIIPGYCVAGTVGAQILAGVKSVI